MVYAQECHCTINQVLQNEVKPCDRTIGTVDTVYNAGELRSAINQANAGGGNYTVLIANGTYPIASVDWFPYITSNNIVFRSLSGNRDSVILTGQGMKSVDPKVESGFYLAGNNIVIADLTIRDVGNHGIAMQSDSIFIHNVRIQNTYEQMIKGTSAGDGPDFCIVQCSLFEYPAGIGPQYYIGGLDIHEGNNWQVRDNIFIDITSPSGSAAEHAIHFWDNSGENLVERNLIINCDRGIGFGLGSSANDGGIIRNNMIYNNGLGKFDDVGIGLETSPNTSVYNNTVYLDYPNAIEYRFAATVNVEISNNLTKGEIKLRNGAQANLSNNVRTNDTSWFINASTANLRIKSKVGVLVDQGKSISGLVDDVDKTSRPQGGGMDIGAHEFQALTLNPIDAKSLFTVWPNPAHHAIHVSVISSLTTIEVYTLQGQLFRSYEISSAQSLIEIDCRNWAEGLYIIQAINENGKIFLSRIAVTK